MASVGRLILGDRRQGRTGSSQNRGIVDAGNIDGHGSRGGIQINATVQYPAIILNLKGERCITSSVGISNRGENEFTANDFRLGDPIAGVDSGTVIRQRSGSGQCGNLNRQEAVCRIIIGIAETKIGRGKGVGRIFQGGDGRIGARWGIVDRRNADGRSHTGTRLTPILNFPGYRPRS